MDLSSVVALDSAITAVTLHRSGALVTRSARLDPGPDGSLPGQIRLPGLPLALEDDSIRVRIESDGPSPAPVARGLRLALEVPGPPPVAVPSPEEEVRRASREVRRLESRRDGLERARARAERATIPPRPKGREGEPPLASPFEARRALAGLLEGRRRDLFGQLREVMQALHEARRGLEDARRRHELASSHRVPRDEELRKTAFLILGPAEPDPSPLWVRLEYRIPGARWVPTYTLRCDPSMTSGTLELGAMIAQRTGEDWSAARITLSTAAAVTVTELPELRSRRIGRRQPRRAPSGWRPPPEGVEQLYADFDRAMSRLGEGRAAAAGIPLPGSASGFEDLLAGGPPPPPPPGKAPRDRSTTLRRPLPEIPAEPFPGAPSSPVAILDEAGPSFEASALLSRGEPSDEDQDSLGPPPPPAQAPPRPSAPAVSMSMSMAAAGVGGGRSGLSRRQTVREPPPGRKRPESPPELAVDPDLLDYGRLRMAGPEAPGRGRLHPVGGVRIDVELSAMLRFDLSLDAGPILARARVQAAAVASLPPPPGCRWPDSVDSYDYAFPADASLDVPSDGQFRTVRLGQRPVAISLSHVVVPRESSEVFRIVRFVNREDAPLLSGPVDVIAGGHFLLSTSLETVAPGGETTLGLGIEPGIRVARNSRYSERTTGLLGGERCLKHEILIDLRNNLGRPARLEVRERTPVPAAENDRVRVSIGRVEPAWKPFDQSPDALRGGHQWILHLEPGADQRLEATYEIQIPASSQVAGGNRREA